MQTTKIMQISEYFPQRILKICIIFDAVIIKMPEPENGNTPEVNINAWIRHSCSDFDNAGVSLGREGLKEGAGRAGRRAGGKGWKCYKEGLKGGSGGRNWREGLEGWE